MMTETDQTVKDEYDFDSSDEEDIRNTVGNIPVQWYESLAHIGYDTTGRPIMKPDVFSGKNDAIDTFLRNTNTGDGESELSWRSVRDPQTGQLVVLSDKDLEIVTKLAKGEGVFAGGDGPFEPWNEWFTKDVMQTPVTAHPPQKRSFIPSLLDKKRVGRMVHAIKSGWFVPKLPVWALSDSDDLEALRRYGNYMTSGKVSALDSDDEEESLGFPSNFASTYVFPDVWQDQDQDNQQDVNSSLWRTSLPLLLSDYRPPRPRPYRKAPEEPLPGHIASYNPPPEFLLSKDEEKKLLKVWRERVYDGHVSRIPPQMPRRFSCLRHVPFSERYLHEREERVKDLLLATRVEKQRVATTPESVLPTIPSLSQLRPYPSHAGILYKGHKGRVTSLSISPCGQWLASISPVDGFLCIWETSTNYCFRAYHLGDPSTQPEFTNSHRSEYQTNENIAGENSDPEIDEDSRSSVLTALVLWNPNPELHLIAASIGSQIYIINPSLCDQLRVLHTDKALVQWFSNQSDSNPDEVADMQVDDIEQPDKKPRIEEEEIKEENDDGDEVSVNTVTQKQNVGSLIKWIMKKGCESNVKKALSKTIECHRLIINISDPVISLDWHPKGDYLLSLSRPILSDQVRTRSSKRLLLHRLSKMSSQSPFADSGRASEWRQAAFHPSGKPYLFIASSRSIRIYDLAQQKELRSLRLDTSSDLLSSMALHPSGEHLVVGTFGSRFNWFDIELGNVPFKKLQLKHGAVRHLDIHLRRPLVSVALGDGTVLIIHGKVTDDLLSKPIVIPVQLIHTGQQTDVLATTFHCYQPHVYTGGADGSVRQFVAWR